MHTTYFTINYSNVGIHPAVKYPAQNPNFVVNIAHKNSKPVNSRN